MQRGDPARYTYLGAGLTAGDPLPALIVTQIEEADAVAVSAISCWEVAYLVKRGRLKLALPIRDWMDSGLRRADVQCLEIDEQIALQAAQLPDHHRDPADRIIIATALKRHLPLISLDHAFASYAELNGLLIAPSP